MSAPPRISGDALPDGEDYVRADITQKMFWALKNVRGDAAMSDRKVSEATFKQVCEAIAEAREAL